ncbi:uncharacterized protein LODBEIA_P55190 [Lodderomyces beijingensis]|uniref:Uncharacterized protein n=1 Tax=Lodderomyces beijingensis TaxID=1775926 RepID=A0ABP0ZWK6_9ASCO
MISILLTFLFINLAVAAPLPALITRYHTAAAVTQVVTQTTGTTTVWLPPVGIYVLPDGSSSTSTINNGQWNTFPVTFTSHLKQAAPPSPVTQVVTQTTGTTTVWVPPVGIYIKPDGSSFTSTVSEGDWHTAPVTFTSSIPGTPTTQAAAPQPSTLQTLTTTTSSTLSTQSTSPPPPPPSSSSSSSPGSSSLTISSISSTTTTPPQSSSSSSSSSSQGPSSTIRSTIPPPSAIVYSPYADNGGCKSANAINQDLELIASKGIKSIRSYGTDCGSLTTVLSKCRQLGLTVNQGAWMQDGVNSVDDQVQQIIRYGQQNGWDVFDLITIGNEAINSGFVQVNDLINKLNSVKSQLQAAGYHGHVTTAEPPISFINHPQLCTQANIDIVGVNPHSYFNSGIFPSGAGAYIMAQKAQVEAVCSKKASIIETGYPSQGATLGVNVPSDQNQYAAISSIIEATGGDVTILTTFNDYWKQPGPYGIEQYFGAIHLFD